jgi:hypothetical protein
MVPAQRDAVGGRAQQPAQALAQRDPPATRLAHLRARRLVAEEQIGLVELVKHRNVPLNEMSDERFERVPGTPPRGGVPGGCA